MHAYMSALGDANAASKAALHLCQMHNTGHAHNLQHAIPMGRLAKDIISFGSPRITSSSPTVKRNDKIIFNHRWAQVIQGRLDQPEDVENDDAFDCRELY